MKKGFILGAVITFILTAGLTFANNMISNVYYSSFPIRVNGQTYTSEMPILNYQGRTYLPLREFGNATGVNVDFQNSTILVDNFDFLNTKFFLYDSFMVLDNLSRIDKNINSMFDSYISFLGGTDLYATSNITNLVNANNLCISALKEYNYVDYFKTFGTNLGLDSNLAISQLYIDISNYINEVEKFNQTVTNAMYLKTTSQEVSAQWDKLYDDYQSISYKLSSVVLMTP